ncbi:MAG: class I SAM-dependent methyltransferase [Lachnospiraceae bacterium]|nr:class I SAM-dependent methyltransferase [Lachnospiraceae bacterium]
MNEVNKTLFIPLYGKAFVSNRNIILKDSDAERIWAEEGFKLHGKSKSKWLAYNMAMRARVFDDWTDLRLENNRDALVLHVGCGLDSRYRRIKQSYKLWLDCDLPDVIAVRRKYYEETENYRMVELDATNIPQIESLLDSKTAIVVLEGISMYLSNEQLYKFFRALQNKYEILHILMDVYTEFGAKASKYKNPVNDVGVTKLYGIDDIEGLISDLRICLKGEHSFTPEKLVDELHGFDKKFFKLMFTGRIYGKIYRLYELEM